MEDGPPLDTVVSGLRGVSVGSFPDNNVALFVLDFSSQLGQLSNGAVQGIRVRVVQIHVYDAVNVESHILRLDTGILVQEAVLEVSLVWSGQRDLAVGGVSDGFQNLMSLRPIDDKVTGQLAAGLRVPVPKLEGNGELVALVQVFEETPAAIRWKKNVMRGRRKE